MKKTTKKPLKRQAKKKRVKKKKIPKKKKKEEVKEEKQEEVSEEELEEQEEQKEQDMQLPFYADQGSASLEKRQQHNLEQQAAQMPLSRKPSEDFKGYDSAKAGTYDSGKANPYDEGSSSENPYETGEKKESEKDLRGYESLASSRTIQDDKEKNPFLDTMAGARGQVQDISQDYKTLERETENYKYAEHSPTDEIDVDKSRRGMKKESVEFN